MRWLKRSWQFISPANFASIISNNEAVHRNYLLLSFDDGFSSNRKVVEDILNPMGIQALFFIVSKFASLSKKDDWRAFVAKNMYPHLDRKNVPDHWFNMNWNDINYLLETGHTIGAHTASHARLSELILDRRPRRPTLKRASRSGLDVGVAVRCLPSPTRGPSRPGEGGNLATCRT